MTGLPVVVLLGIIPHARLTQPTLAAFDSYVRGREAAFEKQAGAERFLWAEETPERWARLRREGILVAPLADGGATEAGDGLIHDWMGAVFLPDTTLERTLRQVQDYDRHKASYAPEVVDSKLVRREGDFFSVYLRLRKHKVITVTLNTEYDVTYRRLSPKRAVSRSYSTRIAEVDNAGEKSERELAAGDDHGFLWRLQIGRAHV
jgi:hypothetical protein